MGKHIGCDGHPGWRANCATLRRRPARIPLPVASGQLLLVETEDLVPLIAPIVWLIFGPMMALPYPTQPLRVAARTPMMSFLHFVDPKEAS